jgi:hypothetical protein
MVSFDGAGEGRRGKGREAQKLRGKLLTKTCLI